MEIVVWSKQHGNVLNVLNDHGKYVAKKEHICCELQEDSRFILEAYDWYVRKISTKYPKPADVSYPVWVSLSMENTMIPSGDNVILEMEIDERIIMPVNINKWSMILNYSYIPKDEGDAKRHRDVLRQYNVSDVSAYMSSFYPQIRMEIICSWDRLFDDSIAINNNRMRYGTVWELRKEWIVKVIR